MKYIILFLLLSLGFSLLGQTVPNRFGTLTVLGTDIADNTIDSVDISPMGGATGQVLTLSGAGNWIPQASSYDIFGTQFELNEDFIGGQTYTWDGALAGGSDIYENHPGIGSYTAIASGGGIHTSRLISTQMKLYADMKFQTIVYAHPTFSTSADSFTIGLNGVGDNDAIFFIFKPNDNITLMTIKDGTPSSIATTVNFNIDPTNGSDWFRAEWVVNGAGTSVQFFLDGVSVGTISANLPTGVDDTMSPLLYTFTTTGFEIELDAYRIRIPNLNR